jgi:hypothetical protein
MKKKGNVVIGQRDPVRSARGLKVSETFIIVHYYPDRIFSEERDIIFFHLTRHLVPVNAEPGDAFLACICLNVPVLCSSTRDVDVE